MTYFKLSLLFNAALACTLVGCGSDDSGDSGDDGSSGGSTNSVSNGGSGGTSAGGTGGSAAGGTGGSTAGGTGGSTAGGTGGTSAGGTGGTTGGGTTGGNNACSPLDSSPSDECTAYRDCGVSACESEYEECLGPNAASGDYSGGVCDGFFECLGDCQSGDTCDIFCVADCAAADEACQTCLSTMDECGSEACPDEAEACDGSQTTATTTGSTTGGGATGTCMDFEDCCNSLEGEDKTGCLDTLEQVAEGGDEACAILLSIYQTGGQCPS